MPNSPNITQNITRIFGLLGICGLSPVLSLFSAQSRAEAPLWSAFGHCWTPWPSVVGVDGPCSERAGEKNQRDLGRDRWDIGRWWNLVLRKGYGEHVTSVLNAAGDVVHFF